ncbi:MAG TPA: hypothetical protein VHE57_12165 [Mycobacteriales bacterium]|nr:hypothetical protein [Mycobacteriales bacterium]
MAIAVSVIVVVGLAGIGWALVVLVRRLFGGAAPVESGPAIPFGGLPELGPVGPLGELSPGADIGDLTAGPDDLIGP